MAPYNPPSAHYAHINVSQFSPDFIWSLIGTNKKGFYDLTKKLNLRYIWYNEDQQRIELWGPYEAFINGAVNAVNKVLDSQNLT
jgi:hypothetical protein